MDFSRCPSPVFVIIDVSDWNCNIWVQFDSNARRRGSRNRCGKDQQRRQRELQLHAPNYSRWAGRMSLPLCKADRYDGGMRWQFSARQILLATAFIAITCGGFVAYKEI